MSPKRSSKSRSASSDAGRTTAGDAPETTAGDAGKTASSDARETVAGDAPETAAGDAVSASRPRKGPAKSAGPRAARGLAQEGRPAAGSPEPPVWIDGRYRVLEVLGRGGMSQVYRVEDRARPGQVLALKRLEDAPGGVGRGLQFQREFLCMTRLRHPSIVEVYDFGITAGRAPYFTMEYVPGRSLTQLPANAGFETLYPIFAEILEALSFVHGRGVLHRDLKPQNLLWLQQGEAPRIKLTDFGLAETIQTEVSTSHLGTVLYTPPEIACGMKADQRSDLYSLGVVLYEVLAGHPPFTGTEAVEILRQHLDAAPPELVPRGPVPPGLLAIVQKMLQKRRGDRYSSAEEVLQALEELTPGLRRRDRAAATSMLTGDFIGREREMSALSEALGAAQAGRGRTVFLGGEAGSGKNRLLREFRSTCQVVGLSVALVQCQGPTSAPYQPLADLAGQLGLRSEDAGRFGLESLFEVGRQEAASPSAERSDQLVESFTGFLEERARTDGLSILMLEDLHNAGEAMLTALRRIGPAIERSSVLVVGTYLHEAVYAASVWEERSSLGQLVTELEGRDSFTDLVLGRLEPPEVSAMIASMLGQSRLPEGLLDFATEEAEGNPFVVEELMRALIAGEALVRGPEGWSLRKDRLGVLQLPTSVRQIFERRLSACSGDARELARLFSVIGRRIESSALEELVPEAQGLLPGWLDELLRLEVLVAEETAGRAWYELAHNKLREVLYTDLTPELRVALHRRVALHLERLHAGNLDEVASELEHHWAQVGEREPLHRYARLAAGLARRSFAYDRALESLERCRRSASDPYEELEILLEIADLSPIVGQLERATRLYEEALGGPVLAEMPAAERRELEAHLLHRLGQCLHKQGEFRLAVERFEQALALCLDDTPRPVAARCLADLADSSLALGRLDRARECCQRSLRVAAPGDREARARALEIQGKVAWGRQALDEARRCFQEVLGLRQHAGDLLGVAGAYSQLGIVADLERDPEQALGFFHKALEIYEKRRFPRGQAEVFRSLGLVYHRHTMAWEQAKDFYTRSLEILERLGNDYEAARTCYNLGRLYEERGQFDRAVELYLRDMAIVNQVKDYAAIGTLLVRLGNVYLLRAEYVKAEFYLRQALSKLEKAGAVGIRLQPLLWAMRSLCSQEEGDLEEADRRLERAHSMLEPTTASVQRGYVLLMEAQLRRVQGRLPEAETALAEGYSILRLRGTTYDRAFASLVRGRHWMILGQDEEAMRSLEHAREIFEKTGAQGFLQEVRNRITGIGEKRLQSALSQHTGGPGDIATLYRLSRIFNSTLELKELLDRVLQAVLQPIRAQRGYLILRESASGEWRVRSAAFRDGRSESPEEIAALLASGLIETVVASGRPVLSSDAARDPRFADNVPLKLLDVKSILCTPLRAPDRILGVLYLDHRTQRGCFGERDLEFLRLLAAHASRAIENALLYEQHRSTMNSLSVGIVVLNPQGSIGTLNRYAEELLGSEAAVWFQRSAVLGALAHRVLQEGTTLQQRITLELRPEASSILQVRLKPLRDGRGRVRGVLCFLKDVTRVERLKDQLSRESRLNAMGELATRIAGRMRTFLTGVRGLALELQPQLGGDDRVEYVQELLLQVEESERYVHEHLSPDSTVDTQTSDLGRLLAEVLTSLEPELEARHIALYVDLEPDPPVLPVQALQLKEALVNLARNALQALGRGGEMALRTRWTRYPDGRKTFDIAIRDNGPGIAPEHRARIFDPFFTTKQDGHGVGLWMVHNVVKSHGGTIDLQTEPGQGSTFTIRLPA